MSICRSQFYQWRLSRPYFSTRPPGTHKKFGVGRILVLMLKRSTMLKTDRFLWPADCCISLHSGEIRSWRQAEKCDLHIHKKQPHKVSQLNTLWILSVIVCLFSLFLKASFAVTRSWESYCSRQMLSCAVWAFTKIDIRKRKWISFVQVRDIAWGKYARYCCNTFFYTVCSIAWCMQWQV